MQEQTNIIDELIEAQLETIARNLNRLIEHRADIMDVLILEDFSSKALLPIHPSDTDILELVPRALESVLEQRTLEAGYRQLLLDFQEGLTDLINKYSDLKDAIEPEHTHRQDRQQHIGDNNTDGILREYWDEFGEYCDTSGLSLVPLIWNRKLQYSGFRLSIKSISDSDIWLATWRKPDQTEIAVNLSLRQTDSHSKDTFDALEAFDTLKAEKEAIENAFGGSLIWQKEPTFASLGPVVGVYKGITPDRDGWQEQFEWMFAMLEKLNQVFRPFILKSLESKEQIDYV